MLKRLTTPWTLRAMLMAVVAVVSLRPLSAQMPAATLEAMAGQVSILQGANSPLSTAAPLFANATIKAKQMVITGPDSYAKFRLTDGSTFEIFENSKVVFHEDFGWDHLLNIIIGHVKVLIDHSKGPNSNSVTTPTAVISVRGTIFDIVVEDADGTTLVTLDEGWVHVRNLTAPGPERDLRQPGEWVRVFRGQGLMGKQIDTNGVIQKALRAASDALRVMAQPRAGGIPIGGGSGGAGVPVNTGGAQGDKGKGGAAPPPAPPPANGH
jgi:ferric-dicitrate binding protein FerR (iron transport regulator)